MDQGSVSSGGIKFCIAWLGVCATYAVSWQDIAGILASLYSLLMIGEWLWKHGVRSFFERRGWIGPMKQKKSK